MSSLSKENHNIEPLTLKSIEDIEDDNPLKEEVFISFFSESDTDTSGKNIPPEDNPQEEIDLEAEARRVFEEAYREGEKAGFEMGMKKAEPIVKRLNAYIDSLEAFKKEMLERTNRLSVALAIMIAEAIILKQCEEDRETIIRMAKRAMEICEDKYDIRVRVRSDDIKYLSEELIKTMKIIPDDTIVEPGFIIETDFGDIDGSISTQLEELKRLFLSEHGDR